MNTSWIDIIEKNWNVLGCMPDELQLNQGAAVLIPLIEKENGETEILFEQRALDLDVQPAEICFPGGRIEAGETPLEAAVRETEEELLLEREQIHVLGEAEGARNAGIITIHAFLGKLTDYTNTFSRVEVDHVFSVPVSWFMEHEPETYMATVTTIPDEDFPFDLIPGGRDYPWRSKRNPIYFYRHPEGVIWGLTASILHTFFERMKSVPVI